MTNELCVPADAVALAGEEQGSESISPEVGDSVEVTIRGTVSRSEDGNVYIKPTEANGMPLESADQDGADETGPAEGEDTEQSMDSAMRGAGAALVLFILALVGLVGSAQADGELKSANRLDCSTIGTNNWVAFSNQASVVFSVEIDNFSGSDVYMHVFEMATNAVAGDQPIASVVKVSSGTTGGKNWNPTGVRLQSLCVAASTTPYKLTNAAAGTGIMTVQRRREP